MRYACANILSNRLTHTKSDARSNINSYGGTDASANSGTDRKSYISTNTIANTYSAREARCGSGDGYSNNEGRKNPII